MPTPSDQADAATLPLAQAAAHATTALDALLAVSPLAPLTNEEIAWLVQGRALVAQLHRSIEARRAARVVALRGPVGPAVWAGSTAAAAAETGDNEGRDMKGAETDGHRT